MVLRLYICPNVEKYRAAICVYMQAPQDFCQGPTLGNHVDQLTHVLFSYFLPVFPEHEVDRKTSVKEGKLLWRCLLAACDGDGDGYV